jgi:hypothetical protein
MESYSEIYKYLTGVDINKERAIWDERGKGYYGEFLVFCRLMDALPYPSKMLMNLNIPVNNYKTTEIDLIAITPVGIIVYEVKHYKGTIYGSGNGKVWTQYFKTQPNHTFQNPLEQNAYHCDSLRKLLNLPTYSVVVFTNNECDLRLDNVLTPVCDLNYVTGVSQNIIKANSAILDKDGVELIFNRLSQYSNMSIPVAPNGNPTPFSTWIYSMQSGLVSFEEEKKKEITKKNEAEHESFKKKLKTLLILGVAIPVVVTALLLAIGIPVIISNKSNVEAKYKNEYNIKISEIEAEYKRKYNKATDNYDSSMNSMKNEVNNMKNEVDDMKNKVDDMKNQLEEMESKFEKVEKYKKIPLSSVMSVHNLKLEESAENNTIISYNFQLDDINYLIRCHGQSKLIVGLKDGSVKEYYAFSEPYRKDAIISDFNMYCFRTSVAIKPSLLSGVKPDDISYIKFTKIELIFFNNGHYTDNDIIEQSAELLIFDAEEKN